MDLLFVPPLGDQELVYGHLDIGTCPYTAQSAPPGGMKHQRCSSPRAVLDTWDHNLAEEAFGGGNLEACGWAWFLLV